MLQSRQPQASGLATLSARQVVLIARPTSSSKSRGMDFSRMLSRFSPKMVQRSRLTSSGSGNS